MEEQTCWEVLHQSVRQLGDELEVLIWGDQELLDSLVKEAETHMYAEKDCYYQESGAVRRSDFLHLI